MRALITGGAGFVGSHLAEAVLKGGGAVTNDRSTGGIDNIEYLKGRTGFSYPRPASSSNRPHLAVLVDRADGNSSSVVEQA